MRISALRLRLALGFALAFSIALVVLDVAIVVQREREGRAALTARARGVAREVVAAIAREQAEPATSALPLAVREALHEWPADGVGIRVVALDGELLGERRDGQSGDAVRATDRAARGNALVITSVSLRDLEGNLADLRRTMWILSPLLLLMACGAGYGLARWSLAPVRELRDEIGALVAQAAGARLPSSRRRDEVGEVAAAFNELLGALGAAEGRNRKFVREAAHQLRTPLTLVRGEAELVLGSDAVPSHEALLAALSRIARAAHQMHRRVDELALVAEARTTRGLAVREPVGLEPLVRDCVELMAVRAAAADMPIEVRATGAPMVVGDDRLLREAVIELIENACRHGTPGATVRVDVTQAGSVEEIVVESAGAEIGGLPPSIDDSRLEGHNLGLVIVRWIMEAHGGTLRLTHDGVANRVALVFAPRVADPGRR